MPLLFGCFGEKSGLFKNEKIQYKALKNSFNPLKIFFYTAIKCMFIKNIYDNWLPKYINRAFSRYLLRAVSTRITLFEFFWTFSLSKSLKSACCLGAFHVRIALNLLKSTLFIHTECMPCLSKICPDKVLVYASLTDLSPEFL